MKSRKGLFATSIHSLKQEARHQIPLYLSRVPAGFPSPAEDYVDKKLSLDEHLIQHPAATFLLRVDGDSMIEAGIHSGDLLIVDRKLEPGDQSVVVASLRGELTVKRLVKKNGKLFLASENPKFKPIEVNPEDEVEVWGVVVHSIHSVR
jgi:DNA polymerase V